MQIRRNTDGKCHKEFLAGIFITSNLRRSNLILISLLTFGVRMTLPRQHQNTLDFSFMVHGPFLRRPLYEMPKRYPRRAIDALRIENTKNFAMNVLLNQLNNDIIR